jgi:hypothetical protein
MVEKRETLRNAAEQQKKKRYKGRMVEGWRP